MEAPVEEPATEAPVEEPTVEALVEEPVTEAPVEEPTVEALVEEPVTEEPVADAPVEDPVAEAPVEERPIAEQAVEAEGVEAQPVEETSVEQTVVAGSETAQDAVDADAESDAPSEAIDAGIHEHEQVDADSSAGEEAAPTGDVASGTEAIRIRGLVKSFGDHTAVNGIDLTVPAGSFYGIVGPNGAGKTTTLSIVAGLLRADSGDVVICGVDQRVKPLAAKRMMGVLPDRLRTFDRLTGRQLLHYYGLLRGLASDVIEKRVGDLARAFDLGDALNRVVSDYSAGMTKKIMLAGAMIHSPRVLVLDEPFEAVDPVSSAVILDILRAYVAHGGTVILSSHGMDLVERVCSRVAIIVGGDVLAEGTIDEVRAGQTLEARFVELSGGIGEVEGLEWLHTFSD
ncbi:ATP-binding cassette domain-containing protein [Microbacterium sp. C5A9]|nr:ATP-binding cassette domain-containing protein [Microbacterium sp. C5A9]